MMYKKQVDDFNNRKIIQEKELMINKQKELFIKFKEKIKDKIQLEEINIKG